MAMRESGDSIKRMIMAVVDRYHGDEMDKFERLCELMSKNYEQQGKLLDLRSKKEEGELTRRFKAEVAEKEKRIKIEEDLRCRKEEELWRAEKERPKSTRTIRILGTRDKYWDHKSLEEDLDLRTVFDDGPDRVVNASIIHGTLLRSNPVMPAASEAYETLKAHGWEVLWIRASGKHTFIKNKYVSSNYLYVELGETWFLGNKPALVRFFGQEYRPQLGPPSADAEESTDDTEWIEVGKEWVSSAALEMLDIRQTRSSSGRYKLDPRLTEVSRSLSNVCARARPVDRLSSTTFKIYLRRPHS
jgi:hypothetical protein